MLRIPLIAAALAAVPSIAPAQGWPAKLLRWIVPYPPGGSTDIAARPLADRIGQAFGHPGIVENRAGATGNTGIEAAAKSAPDGLE